jgi:hypothetical protein
MYGNSRGFGLNSGNFRYGYSNDQYGLNFGVDQLYGQTRFGVMGLYGAGRIVTSGNIARTNNETEFGGIYFYSNTRRGDIDLLLTAGYLGMENDVRQTSVGGDLTGKVTTGLTTLAGTLTKTFRYGGLKISPNFGFEYGYYNQGSMTGKWGGTTAFFNERADSNLAVIPVGATFARETVLAGGLFTTEFRTRYIANVGDIGSNYQTWMTGSPASALMATKMTDRNAGDIGLGYSWTRRAVSLRGDVGYLFSEHYGDLSVSATGVWKF